MGMIYSVTASIGKEHYKTSVVTGNHSFLADELPESGGTATGPTPTELFISAFASCTAITLRMYADRKGYAVEKIDVSISHTRKDVSGVTHSLFEQKVGITGSLSDDERKRMLEIADKCPIHKVLKGEIEIKTSIE